MALFKLLIFVFYYPCPLSLPALTSIVCLQDGQRNYLNQKFFGKMITLVEPICINLSMENAKTQRVCGCKRMKMNSFNLDLLFLRSAKMKVGFAQKML